MHLSSGRAIGIPKLPIVVVAAAVLGLGALGLGLDRSHPIGQQALFVSILGASLLGAGLGLGARWPRVRSNRRELLALAAVIAWRISYFPIMVFSGHVASIGEWLLLGTGILPVVIYPIFLVAVAGLHGAAAIAASWLVDPPRLWLASAVAPAFLLAALISFTTPVDLVLLPDTSVRLTSPVPSARAPEHNPYLERVTAPGYLVSQRVMLVAAGLTYATIPDTPWARTVKGVLEEQFEANPVAPTRTRVQEHYLAYHSAHALIGCRSVESCRTPPRREPQVGAGPPEGGAP